MSNTLKITGIVILVAIIAGLAMSMWNILPVFSSAPSGLKATVATSSQITLGPGNNITLFRARAGNGACAARIISTNNQNILISFSDGAGDAVLASSTLSGSFGHWQGASTTVAYDSGLYGCGRVTGFSYATATVSVTETR